MKKINYLSLVLLGFTLFSCSNENLDDHSQNQKKIELTKNEVLSIAYDDAKQLSDEEIFNAVNDFANLESNSMTRSAAISFKITKRTFINKDGEFDSQEVKTRTIDIENDIISEICEVEFNNGVTKGLAIVATNAKLPSIIAFIPNKGDEKVMERSGANELLHASKASYLYKAIKTKELVDSLRQPTLEKISKELEIPINEITYEKIENNIMLTDAATTRTTAVPNQPAGIEKLNSSIDPMVKTNWGQEAPYNGKFYIDQNKIDLVQTANGAERTSVPAGCVNVALAQLMGYTHLKVYKPLIFHVPGAPASNTYLPDFHRMTAKPTIEQVPGVADHIQNLIFNLYDMNKTTPQKDWRDVVIASNVTEENMINTMNKYFKYNPKSLFVGDQVLASLRNKHPVLMLTTDHTFIISGLLITEKAGTTRQLVKTNDVYWHANFGWANETTGYYQLDQKANTYFEAGGTKEWCYKMECIKNIRAKDN